MSPRKVAPFLDADARARAFEAKCRGELEASDRAESDELQRDDPPSEDPAPLRRRVKR